MSHYCCVLLRAIFSFLHELLFSLDLLTLYLLNYTQLPPQYIELKYCNILCGVMRGALEMVQLQVQCSIVKDVLKDQPCTEIRIELKGLVKNEMSEEYREN